MDRRAFLQLIGASILVPLIVRPDEEYQFLAFEKGQTARIKPVIRCPMCEAGIPRMHYRQPIEYYSPDEIKKLILLRKQIS